MLDKIIDKVGSLIEKIMLVIFGISIMVLVLTTVYSVIMRYVVNAPVPWIEEIQMILVVWMTFFGICVTILERGNISISLLVDKFHGVLKVICKGFGWIVMAAALVVVMRLGFVRFNNLLNSNQITAVLRIPKYVQYMAVAFSGVVMLVNHCIIGIKDLRRGQKEE